jgi:dienelactone hydrolase
MRHALVLALSLVVIGASPAAAQPETRGPMPFTTWDAGMVSLDGTMIHVVVYYPTAPVEAVPLLAVVHGAGRTGRYMTEMASTFASRGYVALVPDMPCAPWSCDHAANARQIRALLAWGVARGADGASVIAGRVDASRQGVVGHSWGGLAVFLAAQGNPDIDAVVVLDPNDDRGIAAAAAPTVTQPSAHVMAEVMGTCNATNWKDTVFPSTPAPHMRVVVSGAGHCDVEDPTDGLCAALCTAGAGSSTTPTFRRYAVAFMGCVLQGDGAMAPWIGGSGLDADVSSARLGYVSTSGLGSLPCNAMPGDAGVDLDAGPAPDAASDLDAGGVVDASGQVDASSALDAGAGNDAGSPARDAAMDAAPTGASSPAGCGCHLAQRGTGGVGWVLALAALLAHRASRRHALV